MGGYGYFLEPHNNNNMPADVIEILFVISDEELVNIEDNDVESSSSHFSPQDISLPGPSR